MKKHILLISTFILSFVLLVGNVNAEDNIRLSCLYDGNKNCAKWYTLGINPCTQGITLINQTESGDINVYYTTEAISDRSELYKYPITAKDFNRYKKNKNGNLKYENHGEDDLKGQLKEKGCPKYVDYKSRLISYTHDVPDKDDDFDGYYPLISSEPIKENVKVEELKCEYPKLSYQKKFIITQSKDGKITTTYDGEDKAVNFNNDESNTGYNKATGKFDKCPLCVNVHGDYADFYNGESDGSCKSSYSGFTDSENTDWKFTCTYSTADKYTAIKEITLSYNENNFQTSFKIINSNIDKSTIKKKFTPTQLWKSNSNSCPDHLNLEYVAQSELTNLYLDNDSGVLYVLTSTSTGGNEPNPNPKPEPKNCQDLFGDEVIKVINDAMKIIRLVVPILLIILGITDFFRATFSDSEDNMKKDRDRFIKRIIAAIIVFIVPFFVNLVLKIANSVWSDINAETCTTEQK